MKWPSFRRRHAERCRPVTVEVDGKQVTVPVLAEKPMSQETRVYFAEVVAAAKRRFEAEASERCGHTVPSVFVNAPDRVCTKAPHPAGTWHADGSGARWVSKPEALDLHDETGAPRCCCRSAARIGSCKACSANAHHECPERAR